MTTGKLLFGTRHTDALTSLYITLMERKLQRLADGTAKIWDAVSGKELLSFIGHKDSVFGIAFSPDGSRLATAGLMRPP